jgi:hypothetical protein
MVKVPWKFIVVVGMTAAAPFACVVVDDGPPADVGAFGRDGNNTGGSNSTGGPTADECNPVTGAGCPADGSACDLDDKSGHFVCFSPPNNVPVCGACDNVTAFCSTNLTCLFPASNSAQGNCYQYCCTDADCGRGGACDIALAANVLQLADPTDKVGLCVSGSAPACSAPAQAPSGGSCVGGFSPANTPDAGGPDSAAPDGAAPDGGRGDGGPGNDAAPPPQDGGGPSDAAGGG